MPSDARSNAIRLASKIIQKRTETSSAAAGSFGVPGGEEGPKGMSILVSSARLQERSGQAARSGSTGTGRARTLTAVGVQRRGSENDILWKPRLLDRDTAAGASTSSDVALARRVSRRRRCKMHLRPASSWEHDIAVPQKNERLMPSGRAPAKLALVGIRVR